MSVRLYLFIHVGNVNICYIVYFIILTFMNQFCFFCDKLLCLPIVFESDSEAIWFWKVDCKIALHVIINGLLFPILEIVLQNI